MRYLGMGWCNLEWSPWLSLASSKPNQLTTSPGFYRIRVLGTDVLAYMGQTGRGLRERVRSLAVNLYRDEPPWNDPHTAAPGLWAWRVEEGYEYEVSVAPLNLSYAHRQCFEDMLLFEYRIEKGESTLCNHGRFHPKWSRPSNRRFDRTMQLLEGRNNPASSQSLSPVSFEGVPEGMDWCGLSWSEWTDIENMVKIVPLLSGVYRLKVNPDEVVYIGESASLKARLISHLTLQRNMKIFLL